MQQPVSISIIYTTKIINLFQSTKFFNTFFYYLFSLKICIIKTLYLSLLKQKQTQWKIQNYNKQNNGGKH